MAERGSFRFEQRRRGGDGHLGRGGAHLQPEVHLRAVLHAQFEWLALLRPEAFQRGRYLVRARTQRRRRVETGFVGFQFGSEVGAGLRDHDRGARDHRPGRVGHKAGNGAGVHLCQRRSTDKEREKVTHTYLLSKANGGHIS